MEPLRVRIELMDQPGALAGVTMALAGLGVDVASLDVLEVDGNTVVDELLLRLPPRVETEQVEDALRLGGAVQVLSMHGGSPRGDATVRALELVSAVLTAPGDADAPGRALAGIAYADVGMLVDSSEAARFPLAARALDLGVPCSARLGPDVSPLALPTGWVLWVTPAVSAPRSMAVVARRLDVRFPPPRLRACVPSRRCWRPSPASRPDSSCLADRPPGFPSRRQDGPKFFPLCRKFLCGQTLFCQWSLLYLLHEHPPCWPRCC